MMHFLNFSKTSEGKVFSFKFAQISFRNAMPNKLIKAPGTPCPVQSAIVKAIKRRRQEKEERKIYERVVSTIDDPYSDDDYEP